MPTTKRLRRHAREISLTAEQEREMAIGPNGHSAFRSEEARRQAWLTHREHLMSLLPLDGRGWGWVTYAGGGFLPGEGDRITTALKRIDAKNGGFEDGTK